MRACVVAWFLMLALVAAAAPAAAPAWRVDPAASALTFHTTCGGDACPGSFRRFTADIVYDPADPVAARFDVRVDLRSIDLGGPARTAAALGPDALDAAAYPTAYFVTTRFRSVGPGRLTATGELRLHGVIAPVALAVQFTPTGAGTAVLDIRAELPLATFRIADGGTAALHAHLALRAAH